MTTQLYDLPAAFADLADVGKEPQPDFETREVTFAMLEALGEMETRRKLEYLAQVVSQLGAEVEMLKAHASDTTAKIASREHRIENIKAWAQSSMEGYGIDSVKGPLASIRLQKNSQPAIDVTDEASVPWRYRRVKVAMGFGRALEVLDNTELEAAETQVLKQAILEDFKTTGEVPDGVEIDTNRKHVRVW